MKHNIRLAILSMVMIFSVFFTACSNMIEDLRVVQKELTVNSPKITNSGGNSILTFTTGDDITADSPATVIINDVEVTVTGTVTDNGDGTKTVSYDVTDLIPSETQGGSVTVTIRKDGFLDTVFTADYTPDVIITVPDSPLIIVGTKASDAVEPAVTTNYHDSVTVTKTYECEGATFTDWEEVKTFMAQTGNCNKTITVTVTATADKDSTKTSTESYSIFIAAQQATPAAPALSTDKENISRGYIKFENANPALEYTTDGGTTWHDVTGAEFEKPASLYVRTKAMGTAGQAGYAASSDMVEVTITDANVGTKVSAKTVTITVESWGAGISVEKTETGGTVTLTAASGYSDYAWDVDNGASLPAGFTASTNVLTITTTSIASGTYRVTVSGSKGGIIYSTGISVVVQ